jgi:hypothetical protein
MTILRERLVWRAPRTKPSPTAPLSPSEAANVRAALRALRRIYGSNGALARALGCCRGTVSQAGKRRFPSASLAVRVARLANVPLGDVLAGRFPRPGACPLCGQMPRRAKSGTMRHAEAAR